MKNLFENFESELDELSPAIREKAIEIADQLIKNPDYTEEMARKEAVKKAEQWYYDLEG